MTPIETILQAYTRFLEAQATADQAHAEYFRLLRETPVSDAQEAHRQIMVSLFNPANPNPLSPKSVDLLPDYPRDQWFTLSTNDPQDLPLFIMVVGSNVFFYKNKSDAVLKPGNPTFFSLQAFVDTFNISVNGIPNVYRFHADSDVKILQDILKGYNLDTWMTRTPDEDGTPDPSKPYFIKILPMGTVLTYANLHSIEEDKMGQYGTIEVFTERFQISLQDIPAIWHTKTPKVQNMLEAIDRR